MLQMVTVVLIASINLAVEGELPVAKDYKYTQTILSGKHKYM